MKKKGQKKEEDKKYIVVLEGCYRNYFGQLISSGETKFMNEDELINFIKNKGEECINHVSLNTKVDIKHIIEIIEG